MTTEADTGFNFAETIKAVNGMKVTDLQLKIMRFNSIVSSCAVLKGASVSDSDFAKVAKLFDEKVESKLQK